MGDLHGNAPDRSRVALILIDVVNDLEWPGGDAMFPYAMQMAERIAGLRARAAAHRVPTIYVNDNFGRWKSDFRAQVARCLDGDAGAHAQRSRRRAHAHVRCAATWKGSLKIRVSKFSTISADGSGMKRIR